MPSPSTVPPTTLPNGNKTIANGTEPNKGSTSGHVANGVAVEDRYSSMEQNKEKARAIVASSGLNTTKSPTPQNTRTSSSESPIGHANGISSRKRSRSGTRLSMPTTNDYAPEFREQREQQILERLVQHEQLHAMTLIENGLRKDAILRDFRHQESKYAQQEELRKRYPGLYYGIGYAGYANGFQDVNQLGDVPLQRPSIITIEQHKRPGGRTTPLLRIPRKDNFIQAEQIDELVPIRLDIEWDKVRIRDTFTWNIHDRVVDTNLFAHQLVEDMNLDPRQCAPLVREIVQSIHEQLLDYHPHVYTQEEALDPHLPYFAYKNDEMRILIKLHITIGPHTLMDQFEWDINNHTNTPEEFAQLMANDLQLNGEFTTAIAHSIREQCQVFTKSLYLVGHAFDGRPIEDHEIQAHLQPSPMPSPFRPHQVANGFTPYMFDMDEAAFEKSELNLSREERRQKRHVNRRGGPVLPDLRDKRRTVRSLIVSSVLPGAVQTQEDSRLFKRATVSTRGRRAVRDELEESDESEEETEELGLPTIPEHLLTGTARTRAIRHAGLAAQAATKSALGESTTPDSVARMHEQRASTRRVIRDDSSAEPQQSVIVKLKLPRSVIQQIKRSERARSKDVLSGTPNRPSSRQSSTAPGSMGPPTTTPRIGNQGLPGASNTPLPRSTTLPTVLGRVDATGPPSPAHPAVSCNIVQVFGYC
jgi:SWI/SNF-related matrix-associated actin-dependent regulator of chromatin subfamily B member 1